MFFTENYLWIFLISFILLHILKASIMFEVEPHMIHLVQCQFE